MLKLDYRTKNLIYELDLNSRQPFGELARKTGMSKTAVIYKIKKLQESGIIKMFHTVINPAKLGYIPFRLYLKIQKIRPEKENEIIEFLKEKEIVTWLVSIDGRYNLGALILVKNVKGMNTLWTELLQKYANFIDDRHLAIMTKVRYFSRAYLLEGAQTKQETDVLTEPEGIKITPKDIEILKLMAADSRIKITDIASKTKTSAKTVISRIKEMRKENLSAGYKTVFDIEMLGYQYFKLFFRLKDATKDRLANFKGYIKRHPNIVYEDEVLGGDDIEFEVQIPNTKELRKMLEEIRSIFSDIIKDYEVMEYYKEHKWLLLPVKL